ncbi:MAG: ABC transporter permease [Acidobacteria bacterium]|nr:ABC transporter permease [Acidobacteriota bacterium]
MLRWFRQLFAVTLLNLRTLKERVGASLVTVVGIAGVVLVLAAVLSIAAGFQATLASTGSDDIALVLRGGSDSEMTSGLNLEMTKIIAEKPGVKRGEDGQPLASAELFVVINLPKKATGTDANVPLRGVQQTAFGVREVVKIVEGRTFTPGLNEVIVGRGARYHFAGLGVGDVLDLGEVKWTVVGIFTADGSISESEIWCDAKVLQPAYRRGNTFQSVYAKLESPAAFEGFKDALTSDPRLDVKMELESEYFSGQSSILTEMVRVLGWTIAILMGVGAVFGALITMYSAVASRTKEIATLRALGFSRFPVVLSVLTEAMLLAVVGGVLGALLAYGLFNGYQAATINWQSFSQVTFAFAVTPRLMATGIAYALLLGLIGGLLPAVSAARMPVATALRQA